MAVHIKWSKNVGQDYKKLSRQYMNAGYITLKEIIEEPSNNVKCDMWFFPAIYMVRQAVELLLKVGIAINDSDKVRVQDVFVASKHNLSGLYKRCKKGRRGEILRQKEQEWIEKYVDSIEFVDSKSSLFRYPFKDEFMKQYGNQTLDVYHMSNRIIQCYCILNKMIFGELFDNMKLNLKEEPRFIKISSSGINNCYLWESPWSDGFQKQIEGYGDVATFLFEKFKESKDEALFYPIAFLMRNAIEIGLKRLLHMRMYQGLEQPTIRSKRNSHLLYKDLWKSIKPMLDHYSNEDNQDKETLEIAELYIKSLNTLDPNGDRFRYPCSYSYEYKFDDKEVDVQNFYSYLLGVLHFIDGCDTWLDYIKDLETEMRNSY